jgi:hypothetical protein
VFYHLCTCISFAYFKLLLHILFLQSLCFLTYFFMYLFCLCPLRSAYPFFLFPTQLLYFARPVKIELLSPPAHTPARTNTQSRLLRGGRLPTRNLEDSTVKYSHYGKNCSILPHLLLRPALGLRSEFQICLSIVSFCFFTRCLFLETSACRLNAPWREIS